MPNFTKNKNRKGSGSKFHLRPIHFVLLFLGLLILSTFIVQIDKDKRWNKKENKSPISLKRLTSPPGEAVLVNIRFPDTKFKKEGEYKLIVRCKNDEETQEFINKIKTILKDYKILKEKELGKDLPEAGYPWEEVKVGENNSISNIEFTFREDGSYRSKGKVVKTSIAVFDGKGEPYEGWVHKGATVSASADIVPYYNSKRGVGVTLRLKAVQFLKGSPPGKNYLKQYGFDLVEEDWGTSTNSNTNSNTNSSTNARPTPPSLPNPTSADKSLEEKKN